MILVHLSLPHALGSPDPLVGGLGPHLIVPHRPSWNDRYMSIIGYMSSYRLLPYSEPDLIGNSDNPI